MKRGLGIDPGVNICFRSALFESAKICVRQWVAERTAHVCYLTFVMVGVGQDVMNDEGGSASLRIPFWKIQCRVGV